MPAKYSHVKKRPQKKAPNGNAVRSSATGKRTGKPNLHVDRAISQPVSMSPMAQLERTIAQILLIRFEQDIARLFSTHIYNITLTHIPTFIMRCLAIAGPGWVAFNANNEEIKDFFRATLSMDLRQAGERVATKSVLWSYTALRHFAISNNVPICKARGLHSDRLLPHYASLSAHLETLKAMPQSKFSKPPHLGPLTEGYAMLERQCGKKYSKVTAGSSENDSEWRLKIRTGYERLTETLWEVSQEFDVRGYGTVLRDKLSTKWCDCGCSTDHLSEVCEKTVKEAESHHKVRPGKQREWDGRGTGIFGWETEEEEDIWEMELDFVSPEQEEYEQDALDADMTIGELMEWRYIRAEREKEQGNVAFRQGRHHDAITRYKLAQQIEPEMPHYHLNLAAAYLKINEWVQAEKACDVALSQHRSVKGYWRRAQARKAQGRIPDAIKDLRAILEIKSDNSEALSELACLCPTETAAHKERPPPAERSSVLSSLPSSSNSRQAYAAASGSSSRVLDHDLPTTPPPEPFKRSYLDDVKLKIASLPLTIDVPIDLPPPVLGENDRIKRLPLPPAGSALTKLESFMYPSWERYMIQKASN